MILVIFECEAKEGCMDELKSTLKGLLPDTRTWPGCYEVAGFADPDGKTLLFVTKWESKEVHQAYLGWRANPGPGFTSLEDLAALVAGEPTFRYLDPAGL